MKGCMRVFFCCSLGKSSMRHGATTERTANGCGVQSSPTGSPCVRNAAWGAHKSAAVTPGVAKALPFRTRFANAAAAPPCLHPHRPSAPSRAPFACPSWRRGRANSGRMVSFSCDDCGETVKKVRRLGHAPHAAVASGVRVLHPEVVSSTIPTHAPPPPAQRCLAHVCVRPQPKLVVHFRVCSARHFSCLDCVQTFTRSTVLVRGRAGWTMVPFSPLLARQPPPPPLAQLVSMIVAWPSAPWHGRHHEHIFGMLCTCKPADASSVDEHDGDALRVCVCARAGTHHLRVGA